MAETIQYSYVAVAQDGRRSRGTIEAVDETAAFDQIRREGLSPLSLRGRAAAARSGGRARSLAAREAADFLSSLAELLNAGADIRSALGILGGRFERPAVKEVSRTLMADVAGGESLERAFARSFQRRQAFVAPMVAAGEAAGSLPGSLQRAADVIYARLKLRDQLISVLAYPSFVLLSSVAAVIVILLFIIPAIAPLATDSGATPPPTLAAMIAASKFLQQNLMTLGLAGVGSVAALLVALRLGALAGPLERLLLDGPMRRTIGGLVFGAFTLSLGTMLAAGAPISDALRLALRSVSYKAAQRRLEPVMQAVREGQTLSEALGRVPGFPLAVVRLAAVGEASNTVGALLMRGGKLEEDLALRRIETAGKVAGPALIVILGGFLGVMMGSLLSGVCQLGQAVTG